MSSGGDDDGGNFFNSLNGDGNFFENLLTDVINIGTQSATFGVVGVDKGGIKTGVTTEGYKEISGAKAAEEATKLAAEQFEETKKNAEKARQEAIHQNQVDQVTQSNMAASVRAGKSTSRSNQGNLTLGADEKDFLGL